jgi:serine/threonine-protein kinase
MAPEQMLSPSVDARADQVSWGVMAYELLSGAHPNETVPPDGPPFPVAKPKPLGWVQADIPEALAAVVHRTMSYEPGARFASMDEVSNAWRAARGAGGGASPSAAPLYGTQPSYGGASATVASGNTTAYGGVAPTAAISHAPSAYPPTPRLGPSVPPYSALAASVPRRGFPWVAVAVAAVALVALSVAGVLLVVSGSAPTSLPGVPSLALGPKTALLEQADFDRTKFSAPPAEVAKAKAALEAKLTPCLDASVSKDHSFRATVLLAADGRITKATELHVCKEQHPSYYLCTERAQKPPKRGFPTVPDTVFACLDRALVTSRIARVTPSSGESSIAMDLHVEVH